MNHNNVVQVYFIGEFEGRPFLAMEFLDGDDIGTLIKKNGPLHPGDAAAQARAAFAIVEGALTEAGFTLDDVVRTRMYLVNADDAPAVAAVHGDLFRHVRPAATLVVVARLMTPSLLVEVEAEARRG